MENIPICKIYGPWYKPHRDAWALTLVLVDGARTTKTYETEAQASQAKSEWEQLRDAAGAAKIETALVAYESHLRAKGNKPNSIKLTLHRLRLVYEPTDRMFLELPSGWGKKRYRKMTEEMATDSHRNCLAEARSFGRWCSKHGLCEADPFADVEGIGKRKHGKPQLRIDELRVWLEHAQSRAARKKPGGIAALMSVTMGLRASEIVQRIVRDVDDDCRVLWITDDADGQTLKTTAARRRVDIPDEVRPYLQKWIKGKAPTDWLFPGRCDRNKVGKIGHVYRDQVRTWIHQICDEAKVPRVSAHGMRGSFGTLGTLDHLKVLAARMGHESESTTRESYIDPHALRQAAQQQVLRVLRGGKRRRCSHCDGTGFEPAQTSRSWPAKARGGKK